MRENMEFELNQERAEISELEKVVSSFFSALHQTKKIELLADRRQAILSLKEKIKQELPKAGDLIEAIFGSVEFIEAREQLTKLQRSREERESDEIIELKKKLAGWQAAVGRLLIKNQEREFAQRFWSNLDGIFKRLSDKGVGMIRLGIVGQVGIYRTLEKLGFKPLFSTPEEDVVYKTDLVLPLSEKEIAAIQIKYSDRVGGFVIQEVEEINYPTVKLSQVDQEINFSSHYLNGMLRLREKCADRSQRENKRIRGFYIFCASGIFDPYSGEPSSEFLKQIKPEIKKILTSNKSDQYDI
jgi:hypothetical protein